MLKFILTICNQEQPLIFSENLNSLRLQMQISSNLILNPQSAIHSKTKAPSAKMQKIELKALQQQFLIYFSLIKYLLSSSFITVSVYGIIIADKNIFSPKNQLCAALGCRKVKTPPLKFKLGRPTFLIFHLLMVSYLTGVSSGRR